MTTDNNAITNPLEICVAQKGAYPVQVEAGKQYWWCTCGHSSKQPMCDGKHKGSGIKPVSFTPTKSETLYFCGCKQTRTPPLCDGSHNSLK